MFDIYLAGPFFTSKELNKIQYCEKILEEKGFSVFSPRKHFIENGETMENKTWGQKVFQMDLGGIEESKYMVAVYDGMYSDSGTAWEIGYAYAKKKKILLVCDEIDIASLMAMNGCTSSIKLEELSEFDFENFGKKMLDIEQK